MTIEADLDLVPDPLDAVQPEPAQVHDVPDPPLGPGELRDQHRAAPQHARLLAVLGEQLGGIRGGARPVVGEIVADHEASSSSPRRASRIRVGVSGRVGNRTPTGRSASYRVGHRGHRAGDAGTRMS